jgi:hypothetical protein
MTRREESWNGRCFVSILVGLRRYYGANLCDGPGLGEIIGDPVVAEPLYLERWRFGHAKKDMLLPGEIYTTTVGSLLLQTMR